MNILNISRIFGALKYSLDGLIDAVKTEAAFQQELVLVAILVPVACFLEVTGLERALMLSSLVLILMAELMNTGIEAAINRISEERHPLSKKAKDAGSAAVFLAFIYAGVIWGCILFG